MLLVVESLCLYVHRMFYNFASKKLRFMVFLDKKFCKEMPKSFRDGFVNYSAQVT